VVEAEAGDGVVGGDDDGGGAFADRGDCRREDAADLWWREYLLEGACRAALGVGVQRSVADVLDRDGGEVPGCGAVVVHVPLGQQREVGGGSDAVADQIPHARGPLGQGDLQGLVDAGDVNRFASNFISGIRELPVTFAAAA
jgi:hypothetical protein